MCGIAGFVDFERGLQRNPGRVVDDMRDALLHRGPDAGGSVLEAEGRVGLGHRRLSIIDLSETGAQPMESASGRYVIVFNGEIYNFQSIRAELTALGASFRGTSDTEVLLEAIERFGFAGALGRANGMFALALYDRKEKQVSFARDRLGKKPLYIGLENGALAFGSELKALRRHPQFEQVEIDRQAAALFARLGYIPSPHSIYKNICKLPPASYLVLPLEGRAPDFDTMRAETRTYWSMYAAAKEGMETRFEDEDEALTALEERLGTAVEQRLISDVPVGAFLSGGVDSSLVCAVMQERLSGDARTYTVGFAESEFDETADAAELAAHIGSQHTQLPLDPSAALETVGEMQQIFDEPFADASQIPSLLISRLIRSEVTVAISGDGGDEFFGGYKRYPRMLAMERLAQRMPGALRSASRAAPFWLLDAGAKAGAMLKPGGLAGEVSGDRLEKIRDIVAQPDFRHRYEHFNSQWTGGSGSSASPFTTADIPDNLGQLEQMMFLDSICYLPDDVLVKVDRTSMATSLEVRSPLLDYELISTAWRMPDSLRMPDGGAGKVALRKLLARRVPDSMINRPKRGFGVPLNDWLRGPLRELAEDNLNPARLNALGYFDSKAVARHWAEHLSGRRNWGFHLWGVISFSLWHRHWMES
ncbi:asparagine synthase (glutamine-hydrolyzing) [Aurantiacibacter rhizosphaerae]|uniref:asparagine synthase (glutamine-hydrolyzing) n=1 Tax=Aurantiacibacter rhizosphaerae TaxID=2691582 RepID=A0A844XCT3_9SPHN|nr:asparagine synthase (glutamine-hydrolyzing) [Aurantiacibacter rhizosphaerae]MWV27573.1 asparagine synthase (glutamine-hydrolyzing) [Aurantiacibacter rhizosphaerae]